MPLGIILLGIALQIFLTIKKVIPFISLLIVNPVNENLFKEGLPVLPFQTDKNNKNEKKWFNFFETVILCGNAVPNENNLTVKMPRFSIVVLTLK